MDMNIGWKTVQSVIVTFALLIGTLAGCGGGEKRDDPAVGNDTSGSPCNVGIGGVAECPTDGERREPGNDENSNQNDGGDGVDSDGGVTHIDNRAVSIDRAPNIALTSVGETITGEGRIGERTLYTTSHTIKSSDDYGWIGRLESSTSDGKTAVHYMREGGGLPILSVDRQTGASIEFEALPDRIALHSFDGADAYLESLLAFEKDGRIFIGVFDRRTQSAAVEPQVLIDVSASVSLESFRQMLTMRAGSAFQIARSSKDIGCVRTSSAMLNTGVSMVLIGGLLIAWPVTGPAYVGAFLFGQLGGVMIGLSGAVSGTDCMAQSRASDPFPPLCSAAVANGNTVTSLRGYMRRYSKALGSCETGRLTLNSSCASASPGGSFGGYVDYDNDGRYTYTDLCASNGRSPYFYIAGNRCECR